MGSVPFIPFKQKGIDVAMGPNSSDYFGQPPTTGHDVGNPINLAWPTFFHADQLMGIDQTMATTQYLVDSPQYQTARFGYMHFMYGDTTAPGGAITPEESMLKANGFIRFTLTEANNYLLADDNEAAAVAVGMAVHTATDSTTPEHRDENTLLPKQWNDMPSPWQHPLDFIAWSFHAGMHVSTELSRVVVGNVYPGTDSNFNTAQSFILNAFNSGHLDAGNVFNNWGVDKRPIVK